MVNNWYSVLTNGQVHCFFHSTRGVKQGDPLSPGLFILAAEVLSKALNDLFDDGQYVGSGMPKWSANLNHLAYADGTIIFASAHERSLKVMKVLGKYETQSGQKINKGKSVVEMHQNVSTQLKEMV